ncbi:MAG: MBL fold metallo-hydrolase [Dehalococcoidales bacterium]|nr:MBL fold metallo-hydrolase [Dehalococcoidales bacterium]
MQQLTPHVYVENELSMCNSSLVVTDAGVVVVDTPMLPANARKVAAVAERFGRVCYVINTEPHGDHVSGNAYFGGRVIAHDGTRKAILGYKVEDFKNMLRSFAPDSPDEPDFRYRAPDITFSDRLTLYLGAHTFQLINMPGHTPYQVAVYVPEERVVFTSDNVVSGGIPFFHQALPDRWLASLEEYERLDVAKVVPGHGPVVDRTYFARMREIVEGFISAVRATIERGMSLEEAQKNVDLTRIFPEMPRDERTAGIIRMNVARLYEYLRSRPT